MPMNFNFFDWIREGVRRSVLLGVSDAVETIGTPHDDDEAKEKLLSHFQEETPSRRRAGGTPRRKLGRSLKQIQAAGEKPPQTG